MLNPALPTGFIPTVAAYNGDDPGGVLRDEVSGGVASYALDWDRGTQRYSVTLQLSAMQFSVWCAFYFHVIKKGAISFTMPLASKAGIAAHTVSIVPGSYSTARVGGINTAVSFIAETENEVYA